MALFHVYVPVNRVLLAILTHTFPMQTRYPHRVYRHHVGCNSLNGWCTYFVYSLHGVC